MKNSNTNYKKKSEVNYVQQLKINSENSINDTSIGKLIGGYSQTYSIGNNDTISDGSNNCLGANCSRWCGQYPPDTPVGSNTACNSGCYY